MKNTTEITTTKKDLARELKKNSTVHSVLYGILVGVVALMLVFCYFSVFSSSFYLRSFSGEYLVGVVDTSTYENTKKGQLLCVKQYNSKSDIWIGDELFYSGNAGKGSGIVVSTSFEDGYLTVETHGETKNVDCSTIIGKVTNKVDFWGYIVWFFQSMNGVVVLNIALVVIVFGRIMIVATTEPSKKGRELQAKLRKQKRTYLRRKKMLKHYDNLELDTETFEMLCGYYEDNKKQLLEFAKKKDEANAYKYLLLKVYDAYLTKPKLDAVDKIKITNCIELMSLASSFDMDEEYMLTDLILKTELVDFDCVNFCKGAIQFVANTKSIEDLLRFCSVVYVLVKTNKQLRTKHMLDFCFSIDLKLENQKFAKNCDKEKQNLRELNDFIKKFVKNG